MKRNSQIERSKNGINIAIFGANGGIGSLLVKKEFALIKITP